MSLSTLHCGKAPKQIKGKALATSPATILSPLPLSQLPCPEQPFSNLHLSLCLIKLLFCMHFLKCSLHSLVNPPLLTDNYIHVTYSKCLSHNCVFLGPRTRTLSSLLAGVDFCVSVSVLCFPRGQSLVNYRVNVN